jgi:hypothetical protein
MKLILLIIVAVLLIAGMASAEQHVLIGYSGQIINQISSQTPDIGKAFLLVELTIANSGYDNVSINSDNFKVEINDVMYSYDRSSDLLYKIGKPALGTVELDDGERISGYLVFQIPEGSKRFSVVFDGGDPSMEVRYDNIMAGIQ